MLCTNIVHRINTIFTDQVPTIHFHKNTYYAAIKIFKSTMQTQKSHEWRHHFWKQNKHTLISLCPSISAWKCLIIWSSVVYNRCGVPFEYCIGNTCNTFVLDFLCDILYGLLYTLSSHWLSSESTEYVYVRKDKIQISGRWFLSRWEGKTFFHKANISVCKNFKYSNSRWLHFEFPSNAGQLYNYGLTTCTSLLHRLLLIMHKH